MSDDATLYLKLDAVTTDGTLADASGAGNHGSLKGGARLAPDPTFGTCLRTDGAGGHVTLGNTPLGTALAGNSAAFTITAWVQPERRTRAASNHGTRNVFLARASKRANDNLELGVSPAGKLDVYIDTERSRGNIVELGAGELTAGSWHAVAVTFESGRIAVHLDGNTYEGATPQPKLAGANGSPVTLGTTLNTDISFKGRLAHVRAYPRALAADEIERVMRADRTVAASSRVSQPVSFDLVDADGSAVLYITDDPNGRVTNLDVRNTGTAALTLPPIGTATESSHHFELLFRPGTIDPADLGGLAPPTGWTLEAEGNPDGTASVYLAAASATSIAPGDTLRVPIGGMRAAGAGGARGTRVVLKHALDGAAGELEDHLSIVRHLGKPNIPLHFGIVGSNTVLNDGSTPNSLQLRLTNVSKTDAIHFASGGDAPTKLVLAIDAGGDGWDLVETDKVEGIRLASPGVTIDAQLEGESPEWIVTFPNQRSFGPRATLDLTLSGIVTALPTGPSHLHLHYENIPGYWDGDRAVIAEKAPLAMRQDGVGVNTAPAAGLSLHVEGGTDHQVLFAENLPSARQGHAGHFRGGEGVLIDKVSGRRNALVVEGSTDWALARVSNSGQGVAARFRGGQRGVLIDNVRGSGPAVEVNGETSAPLLRAENTGTGPTARFIGAVVADVVVGMGTVPVGAVLPFAGEEAPAGWLFCRGQVIPERCRALRRVLNSDRLPDLRDQVVRGAGNRRNDPGVGTTPGTPHSHQTRAAAGDPVRIDLAGLGAVSVALPQARLPSTHDHAAGAVALNFIIYAGAEAEPRLGYLESLWQTLDGIMP